MVCVEKYDASAKSASQNFLDMLIDHLKLLWNLNFLKFPWLFLNFPDFQQNSKLPWQILKFPDFSLTLKFPDFSLTSGNPDNTIMTFFNKRKGVFVPSKGKYPRQIVEVEFGVTVKNLTATNNKSKWNLNWI